MSLQQACERLDSEEDNLALTPLGAATDQPPPIVYHYTTASSLLNILQSKKLWATDARFLNDSGESRAGIRRARALLRQKYFRASSNVDQRFYRRARELFRAPDNSRTFVFSFSEKQDDLPQWRAYASDGLGFTIGIDSSCIVEKSRSDKEFAFDKVSYNQRHLDARVRRAIKHVGQVISEFHTAEIEDDLFFSAAAFFDVVTSTVSASYKHSSFQAETEWRIKSFLSDDELLKRVAVRENQGALVPYIELDVCGDDELPIKEIGIGPAYIDSEVEYPLKLLLQKANIRPEIYYADTSYRRAII